MFSHRISVRSALAALVVAMVIPAHAAARQRPAAPVERADAAPAAQQVVVINPDQDANQTRERLEELLRKLPPAVGRVLRTDPSLLGNDSYLAPYPVLAAFLKQHPEVRNAPSYFLEHVGPAQFYGQEVETPESQRFRLWRETMQFIAVSGVFLIITGAMIWIIRTLVEYRRWHRTSKVHTEVHNKLMDRFTVNEDLLAYMQSPSGRRFLESAPLSLDSPSRPVGAPLSRILWSVQVGVVLAAGALGMLFVSNRVIEEMAQPFYVVGVIALTVGVGFVVSAGASFLLSRRLGLLEPVHPPREHTESAGH